MTLQPPSHYVVLGLEPAMLRPRDGDSNAAATATAVLRRAYRRALLRNHPDKRGGQSSAEVGHSSSADVHGHLSPSIDRDVHRHPPPSIDQITTAWTVLSDPAKRRAYDQELRALAVAAKTDTATAGNTAGTMTGMEVVDLDDLALDEPRGQWYRSCRCGNERGFVFGEADLEEEMEAQEKEEEEAKKANGGHAGSSSSSSGELLVGCQDCSLWLCVHFAVMDG